jgi:hypothetical protein
LHIFVVLLDFVRQTQKYLETQDGIGGEEDKEDLARFGESGLGQGGLERCGCGSIPPGCQKVKKKGKQFNILLYCKN